MAFSKLNIEAYPNPSPVILEITAQAAGLSAEDMIRLGDHGVDASFLQHVRHYFANRPPTVEELLWPLCTQ